MGHFSFEGGTNLSQSFNLRQFVIHLEEIILWMRYYQGPFNFAIIIGLRLYSLLVL